MDCADDDEKCKTEYTDKYLAHGAYRKWLDEESKVSDKSLCNDMERLVDKKMMKSFLR